MVSSARQYKGIFIFCELAKELKEYDFILVCDATHEQNLNLFRDYTSLPNLNIVETQKELHQFYAKSDLIVNFSIPSLFIETFGLTILEGLSYGIPCIVPPIGGITELVHDGLNGFKVDCRDTADVIYRIKLILEDEVKYQEMSNEAIKIARCFSVDIFIERIKLVLD
jgi:glycosyltransferase involved in cell wall biosynthesis